MSKLFLSIALLLCLCLSGQAEASRFPGQEPACDNVPQARLLLEGGADPNSRLGFYGDTPLNEVKSPEMVALLLQAGADPNSRDKNGNTPLHNAAYSPEVVRLLLAAGADCNSRGKGGSTPLDRVSFERDWEDSHSNENGASAAKEVMEILLEAGGLPGKDLP